MTLFDVLFNWLQLKLASDLRPQDEAARVSADHLQEILMQVHQVEIQEVSKVDHRYVVRYTQEGSEKTQSFAADAAELLIGFINENPERYEFQ